MLSSSDLQFFAAVARSPSLAAAARALSVTPPAVSQRLGGLEERLGIHLVHRGARGMSLTDEGLLLAERADSVLAELGDIATLLGERRGTVRGHLRIAAPSGFGRRHVAPAIASFRTLCPDVRVTFELSDNPVRLRPDAWDLIVHIGSSSSIDMQMVTLASNRRILCASPVYLEQHGTPSAPVELLDHVCLTIHENDEDATLWRFFSPAGEEAVVRIDSPLRCNDGETIREWSVAGLGIILRSEWDVTADLHAGRLVRLMRDWSPPDAPVVALLGPRNGRAARTTRFLDLLRSSLAEVPWRSREER